MNTTLARAHMRTQRHVENINVNGAAQNIRIKHKALEPHTHTQARKRSHAVRSRRCRWSWYRYSGAWSCAHMFVGIARKLYTHVIRRALVCVCWRMCLLGVDAP